MPNRNEVSVSSRSRNVLGNSRILAQDGSTRTSNLSRRGRRVRSSGATTRTVPEGDQQSGFKLRPIAAMEDLFRPHSQNEVRSLRASIEQHGVLVPIVVLPDGQIIDGVARWRICGADTRYEIREATEEQAFELALILNLHRRHLSVEQIREIAQRMRTDKPLRRQVAHGLRLTGHTQQATATLVGVTERTVRAWDKLNFPQCDRSNEVLGNCNETGQATGNFPVTCTDGLALTGDMCPESEGSFAISDKPDCRVSIPSHAYPLITRRADAGESHASIAADYGVARQRIGHIVRQYPRSLQQPAPPVGTEPEKADFNALLNSSQRFRGIVCDPPWPMSRTNDERHLGQPNQLDYDILSLEKIEQFPVGELAAPDGSFLFLWTTQYYLPYAFRMLDAWGFSYYFTQTWRKVTENRKTVGLQRAGGPCFNSEFILVGRKNNPHFNDLKNFPVCFDGVRHRQHSRKPAEFYETVRRVCRGPLIELFSREKHVGFEQFGNETRKFPPRKPSRWEGFMQMRRQGCEALFLGDGSELSFRPIEAMRSLEFADDANLGAMSPAADDEAQALRVSMLRTAQELEAIHPGTQNRSDT